MSKETWAIIVIVVPWFLAIFAVIWVYNQYKAAQAKKQLAIDTYNQQISVAQNLGFL